MDSDWKKKFENSYELLQLNEGMSNYYPSEAEALAALKKLYPSFPNGEHLSPFARKMSDLRLQNEGGWVEFKCSYDAPHKKYGGPNGSTDMPVAGSFALYSPTCGNRNEELHGHIPSKSNNLGREHND